MFDQYHVGVLEEDRPNRCFVLVEPLYAGPAVSLALDSGWGSVFVLPSEAKGTVIPRISFEQPVQSSQRSAQCIVRSNELAHIVSSLSFGSICVLGSLVVVSARLRRGCSGKKHLMKLFFVPVSAADRNDQWYYEC